jgi:hypothetical protein
MRPDHPTGSDGTNGPRRKSPPRARLWRTMPVTPIAGVPSGPRFQLAALALGALLLGGCQAPASQATATPTVTASATASAASTTNPTPTATATAPAAAGPCDPNMLAARITQWQGAAGHRIASVELTNKGSGDCTVDALSQPQLVDGNGAVLIDSAAPAASAALTITPGGVLHTLVQDGNYCGPAPVAPVTVAFVFAPGLGRIIAAPLTATDTTGVPPCNGAPGSAGDIEMQPWSP